MQRIFVVTNLSTLPRVSFWQRRVIGPLHAQLVQGATPDKLAFTAGVSAACSLIPFFGFTTLVNLGVGFWLRLNHPLMQVVNYFLGPVQIVFVVVYVRTGEKIWGAPPMPFSVPVLVTEFGHNPWTFLKHFGLTGVHAATAWLVSVPFIFAIVFFTLRPVIRRFAATRLGR